MHVASCLHVHDGTHEWHHPPHQASHASGDRPNCTTTVLPCVLPSTEPRVADCSGQDGPYPTRVQTARSPYKDLTPLAYSSIITNVYA